MLGIVQDRAAANWIGSNVGLHSPSASIYTETLRACAPGAPVSTSIPGKEPPPIVRCKRVIAVPCNASAYWSRMSKFVCIRQASLCSCMAAVKARSLDNVSHQCPGLISSSQAVSGVPSHSRNRG